MYLQITNRCNMLCPHCCFSCTAKGQDMSLKIAMEAIQLSYEFGEYLAIGGGEPTLHPKFKEILFEAILNSDLNDNRSVFIATNGSHPKHTEMIYKLSKSQIIHGYLSYDKYHNTSLVDYEFYKKFLKINRIRNIDEPMNQGRAKKLNVKKNIYSDCACNEVFIKPNGLIYHCGCEGAHCYGKLSKNNLQTYFNSEYVSECSFSKGR